MNIIEKAIDTLGVPGSIAVVMLIIFAVLQLIGEFCAAFGKVVPPIMRVHKWWKAKRAAAREREATLTDVRQLLSSVNQHYSADNIAQRDAWMQWVNDRAVVYDNTIIEYRDAIDSITAALNANTKMTQQMFVESSRDRIIDFASKVANPMSLVSREEFNRIFKVYNKYEEFLEEHQMTNGEVEVSYRIIQQAYEERAREHNFVEDLRNIM